MVSEGLSMSARQDQVSDTAVVTEDRNTPMSLSLLERNIIAELYGIIGKKIREKDLLEWRNSEIEKQPGEQVFHLPNNGVWVAIPESIKIKAKA
jgi:hypothetical protein